MKQQPRGIRNHNPGNIRHGEKWQGLAAQQLDESFCTFESPQYGIRAIARVLISYQDKHDIDTVRGIINRWAPPIENNTNAYVLAVARAIGVDTDQRIDVHQYDVMQPLVVAIIRHENGMQPYSADVIDEGLKRAGVIRKRPASRDPEVRGVATASALTAGTAGVAAYGELKQTSSDLRAQGMESGNHNLVLAGSGLSVLAVGVLAFVVIRKWKARQ